MTDSPAGLGPARSRLKIAHFVSSLTRGGGERLMIDLANDQFRRDHEVRIICGFAVPEERAHTGLDPHIPVSFIAAEGASRGKHYAALLRWFAANGASLDDVDVVHCHMTSGAVLGTLVQLRRGSRERPAVVETYHAVGMPIPRPMSIVHKSMLKRRDAVAFMVDHPLRGELEATANIPTAVIPAAVEAIPGPPATERRASRASFGISDRAKFVVGTIGRFVSERRPWVYIPVFERVAAALGQDVHFLMGGDGPQLERVKNEADRAGLSGKIAFPGLITDVPQALAAMNLYVTLNVGAVPGVAGLQAMSAGLPAVAYQVVDEYSGEADDPFWSSCDLDAIAERIIKLLRTPEDLRSLAERQRGHVRKHHSLESMTSAYLRFYGTAIEHVALRRRH